MTKIQPLSFLSAMLAVLLLFTLCPVTSSAAEPLSVTFSFSLPKNISYSPNGSGAALAEETMLYAQTVIQPVYDALFQDYPFETMWINVQRSVAQFSYSYDSHQNVVSLTKLIYRAEAFSSFTDPAGMQEQLSAAVSAFVPQGKTLYEKVKSIHDYVCRTVTYDKNASYLFSAYGALLDRRAVCEGYAKAFKQLCDYNGIDCILVTGFAGTQNENHMWNYVRMDDNRWYAVDTTWDDGNGTDFDYTYFLVGSETVVTASGKTFRENHHENGDLSLSGIYEFSYPDLALLSYADASPSSGNYPSGQGDSYFYDQLNAEQKKIYDELLKGICDRIPSIPGATPCPTTEVTTVPPTEVTTVTTPAVTTPEPSTTTEPVTPTETTTATSATTPVTTTAPTVTTPTQTTKPVTTTKTPTTTPQTTVGDSSTPQTTPEQTTSPVTTVPASEEEATTTELPLPSTDVTEPTVSSTEEMTEPLTSASEELPVVSTTPETTTQVVTVTIAPPATSSSTAKKTSSSSVARTVLIASPLLGGEALVFFVVFRHHHKGTHASPKKKD